jgi:hypothetical protein
VDQSIVVRTAQWKEWDKEQTLRIFGEWEQRRQVVEKEGGWMILYILKSHRFKINKKHHMTSCPIAEKNYFFSRHFLGERNSSLFISSPHSLSIDTGIESVGERAV